MKKLLSLLMALVMIFALCACGGSSDASTTEEAPAQGAASENEVAPADDAEAAPADDADATDEDAWVGKTLVIACAAEMDSLLIQATTPGQSELWVGATMYQRLYDTDANGENSPCLATGYEWVDDTHLRVFLRDDVYFTNGELMTAEDVIYSFQLGLEGANAASYSSVNVEESVAEDDFTVVLALNSVDPLFPINLNDTAFAIVSKAGVEATGGLSACQLDPSLITCGPYKFVEWASGQYVMVEYNENYYDTSYVPSYQYIKFIFVGDSAARALAVESGDAALACEFSLSDILPYQDNPDYQVYPIAVDTTIDLFLNCTGTVFENETLRQAIGYMIDWEACAKVAAGDYATPVEGSVAEIDPYYYDYYDREYNPEKGMQMLADAGLENVEFTIVVDPTGTTYHDVAVMIQAYLFECGVNVTLDTPDQAVFFTATQTGEYDSYLSGAAPASTMAKFATAYYDDVNTRMFNIGGARVSDDHLTELVSIINSTFDEDERIQAYEDLQKANIEHRYIYGVCNNLTFDLATPDITNFVYGSSNTHLLSQYIVPVE